MRCRMCPGSGVAVRHPGSALASSNEQCKSVNRNDWLRIGLCNNNITGDTVPYL